MHFLNIAKTSTKGGDKEKIYPPRSTAKKYSYNLNIASGTERKKKKARNEIKGKFMIILIQEKNYGAKAAKKKIQQIYLLFCLLHSVELEIC